MIINYHNLNIYGYFGEFQSSINRSIDVALNYYYFLFDLVELDKFNFHLNQRSKKLSVIILSIILTEIININKESVCSETNKLNWSMINIQIFAAAVVTIFKRSNNNWSDILLRESDQFFLDFEPAEVINKSLILN